MTPQERKSATVRDVLDRYLETKSHLLVGAGDTNKRKTEESEGGSNKKQKTGSADDGDEQKKIGKILTTTTMEALVKFADDHEILLSNTTVNVARLFGVHLFFLCVHWS
jgi:hypothetical protein